MKRYIFTIDCYVQAEDDEQALKLAKKIEKKQVHKKAYETKVLAVDEHPFASITPRSVKL